jgi:hypothetical protein
MRSYSLIVLALVLAVAGCATAPKSPSDFAQRLNGPTVVDTNRTDATFGWGKLEQIMQPAEELCRSAGGKVDRKTRHFNFAGQFSTSRDLPTSVTCFMPDASSSWVIDASYSGTTLVTTVMNPGTRLLDARVRATFGGGNVVAERLADQKDIARRDAEASAQRAENSKREQADRQAAARARVASIPAFQAALKPGDRFQMSGALAGSSSFIGIGLVVEVKPPLAFVQFDNVEPSTRWVEIKSLEPLSQEFRRR